MLRVLVLILAAVVFTECSLRRPSDAQIASEVHEFLSSYAADLRAGNGHAVADRYSREGAFFLGSGRKEFSSFEDLKHEYLTSWQPPADFQWCDISVEVLAPSAAIVAARFSWGDGTVMRQYSYSALLIKEDREFRLRLEDESPLPATAAPQPCIDSAFQQ